MKLTGQFYPAFVPEITGLTRAGGHFWIAFVDDEEITHGAVRINLTVPARFTPGDYNHSFASFHFHYDSLNVIYKLNELGFLKLFEELKASTFYDVVQCCVLCNIPITYYGEDNKELIPRKVYEIIYPITAA